MDVASTATCVSANATNGAAQAPLMRRSRSSARSPARPQRPAGGLASSGLGRRRSTSRLAADAVNGFRLVGDVGQEPLVGRSPQTLFDQGPQDDLHADGKLHGHRRPPGQAARAIDELTGQDDEHAGLVDEHAWPRASLETYITYISHIIYFITGPPILVQLV